MPFVDVARLFFLHDVSVHAHHDAHRSRSSLVEADARQTDSCHGASDTHSLRMDSRTDGTASGFCGLFLEIGPAGARPRAGSLPAKKSPRVAISRQNFVLVLVLSIVKYLFQIQIFILKCVKYLSIVALCSSRQNVFAICHSFYTPSLPKYDFSSAAPYPYVRYGDPRGGRNIDLWRQDDAYDG